MKLEFNPYPSSNGAGSMSLKYQYRIHKLWRFIHSVWGLDALYSANIDMQKTCMSNTPLRLLIFWSLQVAFFTHLVVTLVVKLIHQPEFVYFAEFIVIPIAICTAFLSSLLLHVRRAQINELIQRLTNLPYRGLSSRVISDMVIVYTLEVASLIAGISGHFMGTDEAKKSSYQYFWMDYNNISSIEYDELSNSFDTFLTVENILIFLTSLCLTKTNILFFSYVCKMIALNFKRIGGDIQHLCFTGPAKNYQINKVRDRFVQMKDLVDDVSKNFSPMIIVWFLFNLIIVCCNLRAIHGMKVETAYRILYFVMDSYVLTVLYRNAAEIHKQARITAEFFGNLVPNEENTELLSWQLNFHMTQVAVNASGVFYIDTHCILTMIGTMLTYAVVLFQTSS